MMNEKEGPSKGSYINIRVENDGGISVKARGNKIDIVYLWALLGGQISRENGLSQNLLGMMFLSMSEEFAGMTPDKHIKIKRRRQTMRKIKYYLKALRWLWANRSWENTRQKWKALGKYMKEVED